METKVGDRFKRNDVVWEITKVNSQDDIEILCINGDNDFNNWRSITRS